MAKFLQRLTMAAVLVGGLTALAATTADAARPDRPGSRAARPTARRSFQLFAGNPTGELQVNRVYCGMTDAGESCTDVTGSTSNSSMESVASWISSSSGVAVV